MGVQWIVNNERSSKAVAILSSWWTFHDKSHITNPARKRNLTVMGMVPECTSLVRDSELIEEGMSRSDGALGDADGAVGPLGPFLE